MSAVAEKVSTELTVPERAALALEAGKHEKELRALVKKSETIIAIKNTAGRDQCHSALMTLANARIAVDKAGKLAREDANAFRTAVIAEAERLISITVAEETRLRTLRDDWDTVREAEKEAKREVDRQRVAAIHLRINEFRAAGMRMTGKPSAEITAEAERLTETVVSLAEFGEMTGEAQQARDDAVKQLRDMAAAMAMHEAEQQRLADERAEFERQQAEQKERDRIAAVERAEQQRKDAAAKDAQEAIDREAREVEQARQDAIRRQQEADLQAQRDAHAAQVKKDKDEADERDRIARVAAQKVADAAAEIQRQRDEIVEQERLRAEAIQRDADHGEALIENDRIDAERAERIAAQERAEAERVAALPVAPIPRYAPRLPRRYRVSHDVATFEVTGDYIRAESQTDVCPGSAEAFEASEIFHAGDDFMGLLSEEIVDWIEAEVLAQIQCEQQIQADDAADARREEKMLDND